jgi:hypothetical protein
MFYLFYKNVKLDIYLVYKNVFSVKRFKYRSIY